MISCVWSKMCPFTSCTGEKTPLSAGTGEKTHCIHRLSLVLCLVTFPCLALIVQIVYSTQFTSLDHNVGFCLAEYSIEAHLNAPRTSIASSRYNVGKMLGFLPVNAESTFGLLKVHEKGLEQSLNGLKSLTKKASKQKDSLSSRGCHVTFPCPIYFENMMTCIYIYIQLQGTGSRMWCTILGRSSEPCRCNRSFR